MAMNDRKTRDRHAAKAKAARRDLERLAEQSEKLLGAAHDTQQPGGAQDWSEVWGRRIGRALGVVAVIYLIYYLVGLLSS